MNVGRMKATECAANDCRTSLCSHSHDRLQMLAALPVSMLSTPRDNLHHTIDDLERKN